MTERFQAAWQAGDKAHWNYPHDDITITNPVTIIKIEQLVRNESYVRVEYAPGETALAVYNELSKAEK